MTKIFVALLVLLAVLPAVLRAEDIVLVDGRYLQVKCLEATDTRVKVHLLDTGGEVWIPWALIREEDRKRLRIRFGLEEDEAAKTITEEGVKLVTTDGTEYLGVPVEPLDPQGLPEKFELWYQGRKWPFTKAVVRSLEVTTVPSLSAFSAQQLYDKKLAEIQPADDDLQGHWDLARFCMAIDSYEKAAMHLRKVQGIDPDFEAERVGNHLARMEAMAKDLSRAEAIRAAKMHARDKRFDRALADMDQILSLQDLSPILKSQAEQAKEWIVVQRYEYFKVQVRREYFAMLNNKLGKLARDEKIKLKDAQKELRTNLHKEILADIATKFNLDPKKEVPKMWEERVVNTPLSASYGSGSFIVLGQAPGAKEREQQLQQAMARAMAQNQRQSSSRGNTGQTGSMQADMMKFPKPPTPDEWWTKIADSAARADWMKAYYAEQCKMLKIVSADRREDCVRCGATGTIKFAGQQGETIAVTCPRCHGHKYDKGVAFK